MTGVQTCALPISGGAKPLVSKLTLSEEINDRVFVFSVDESKDTEIMLIITGIAVIIGIVIGFLVAVGKTSQIKIVKGIATCYVDVLRGTPLLVQALLLYSGVPMILQAYHITFRWEEPIVAGIIACGINSSAYVGEIIRGGLKAVDKGQIEAAKRSEEHTSELQSPTHLVCRLLLEKKK